MTPSNDAPIDPSVVATLRTLQIPGQPDVLTELIDLFLDDAPARIAAVRNATRDGDAGALRRAAHALNGSSANLGAVRLAAISAELEQVGQRGTVNGAATVGLELKREYDRVAIALRAERQPT